MDTDDEDEAPTGKPEYGDLLDAEWLERVADALERDDDLIDVGLTLDLDDRDDGDELAQVMDLDVGILLTSLPLPVSREGGGSSELNAGDGASPDSVPSDSVAPDRVTSEGTEREFGEGSLSVGALRDLLLPEERAVREAAEDDAEVGDDERFPAFESSPGLWPRSGAEDDSGEGEE